MMAWWRSRAPRERLTLVLAGVLAVLMLGWAWVWDPLQASLAQERARAQVNEAAWSRMQALAEDYRRLRASVPVRDASVQGSLLARVDSGLNGSGIGGNVLRIDPQEAGRVRVQFQAVDFDALMRWLETRTAQDGLQLKDFSAQRVSAGRVDATLVIEDLEA